MFWLLSCDLRAQNCNCLVVSSVVIGPVILCWCLVLLFQTNRATHEQIRMACHRSRFRIIRSSWSSVIAILASACVSSVGLWHGSHNGPCHQRSEHLLIFPPRLPKSAGFSFVHTCLHWMYSFCIFPSFSIGPPRLESSNFRKVLLVFFGLKNFLLSCP